MIPHSYAPTTPEAIQALTAYLSAASSEGEGHANLPDPKTVLQGIPQGSLVAARYDEESGLVAFTIKDRSERFIEPEGFLVLRALTLFNGGAYFDKNQKGGHEYHYLEVFSGPGLGITFQRLLTDAQEGEVVKLKGDHHLLTAANFVITHGARRNARGRHEALQAALEDYDKRAAQWGLAANLSRAGYEALLLGAFSLYDLKYGHHLRAAAE